MGYLVQTSSGHRGFVIPKAKFEKALGAFKRLVKKHRYDVIQPDAVLEAPDFIAALQAAGFGTKVDDSGDLVDISYRAKLPSDPSESWPEPLIAALGRFARAASEISFTIGDDPELVHAYRVFPGGKLDRNTYIPLAAYIDAPQKVTATYTPGLVLEIPIEVKPQQAPFEVPALELSIDANAVTDAVATVAPATAPVPSTAILTVRFDPAVTPAPAQYTFRIRGTQPIQPRADEHRAPYSTRDVTILLVRPS